MKCFENQNGKCVIQNDCFNDILDKIIKADGILLGSPVYAADATSQMKAFMKFMLVSSYPEPQNKYKKY
jgi:multimeric flavodoxin WrbA